MSEEQAPEARRKVVVTGASGNVARRMLRDLRQRYDLTLLDVRNTNQRGAAVIDDIVISDLTNPDRDSYRQHFRGVDAVVHCGYVRVDRSDLDGHFKAEIANIQMAYNLYRVCSEESVRRVVVVGSNHATDYYERLLWGDQLNEILTPELRPLSDNIYGWAKACYEHLGFVFATGVVSANVDIIFGDDAGGEVRPVENIQIRLGRPKEDAIDQFDPANSRQDSKKIQRTLGAYLSVRDQVQLVTKCIETPDIRDQYGIPFQIFYGISGNSRRFWSLDNACRVIDYRPEDDSEVRFAERVELLRDGLPELKSSVQS